MNLNTFSRKGILSMRKVLAKKTCNKIVNLLESDRQWDQNLFLNKKDYLKYSEALTMRCKAFLAQE